MKTGLLCASIVLLILLSACSGQNQGTLQNNAPGDNSLNSLPSQDEQSSPTNNEDSASGEDLAETDEKGITGMDSFTIQYVFQSDPFCIPMTEPVPAPEAAEDIYSASCSSSGSGNSGVLYDYSLTLDSDEEVISGSFGVSSTGANEQELLTAADLYFYTISIIPYDTAEEEILTTWFEDNLPKVTSDGITTTVGDATYQLYGNPGSMYWVDISKNTQ